MLTSERLSPHFHTESEKHTTRNIEIASFSPPLRHPRPSILQFPPLVRLLDGIKRWRICGVMIPAKQQQEEVISLQVSPARNEAKGEGVSVGGGDERVDFPPS